MVKKLKDLCLVGIGQNLHRIKHAGKHLPTVHKEKLIEYLAFHDLFTERLLPHATYNLFSPSLKHINLYKCDQVDDHFLHQISLCGAQLTHLAIHNCINVSDKGIRYITEGQENLEVLELRKLTRLTSHAISNIFSGALWKVDLRGNTKLGSEGVKNLVINNPNIQEMDLTDCHGLDDSVFDEIANSLAKHLNALILCDLHFISDSSVISLSQKCPNLTKLVLHGCNRVTSDAVKQLSQQCKKLKQLNLAYCQLGRQSDMECLNVLPVSISELSLCGVQLDQPQMMTDCIKRLVNLTHASFCGVPALNDDSLEEILCAIGQKLEFLDLSGSVTSQVTDEGLKAITKYCTSLEELAISLISNVTGVSLIPLLQDEQRAALLRVLKLSNKKLDIEVLYCMAMNCHNLEFLSVAGLREVDDQVVMAISENCPKLKGLILKGCLSVTDMGVCEIARCCPSLTILVLAGLHKITDKSIFALASSCVYLEEIYLNGCAKVSPVAVTYLLDCCMPRLYIQHKTPNADPNQLMAKNLDTGEFCRADLLQTS